MKWTTNRQDILDVPVPNNTESYTAIPHSVFLTEVQGELTGRGYEIEDEKFLTSDNRSVISGSFKLKSKSDDIDLAPSVNFVNSYNKKRSAVLRAGAQVLKCKNGMIGSSNSGYYNRKHTGNALEEFRSHIKTVIDGLDEEFQRLVLNKNEMKRIILSKKTKAYLMGDMYLNEKLITSTQAVILQKETRASKEFKGNTLWDFYNNCTESFKSNNALNHDNQHIKFHTYICDKFQLTGHKGLFEPLDEYAITTSTVSTTTQQRDEEDDKAWESVRRSEYFEEDYDEVDDEYDNLNDEY